MQEDQAGTCLLQKTVYLSTPVRLSLVALWSSQGHVAMFPVWR